MATDTMNDSQIREIVESESRDPFAILGMHVVPQGIVVRAFMPHAVAVKVREKDTGKTRAMENHEGLGFFSVIYSRRKKMFDYEFIVEKADGSSEVVEDTYRFPPVMSEDSRFLFNEGNHQRMYEDLGAHIRTIDGVKGVVFDVWAPNARRVSVVGSFNDWDGRRHPMRHLGASGVWEVFVPGLEAGTIYKYEIRTSDGHLVLKTDPCGYLQEPFPYHGSIVADLNTFQWDDKEWMDERHERDRLNQPMTIYELHLGSWRKSGPGEDDCLNYRELAEELVAYLDEAGFTHVELMPVQEHPYVPSWGYQVGGFYAPNHRFGTPEDFQYFVDYLHRHGFGVIMDWVSGHFPKDEYGLARFDGTHLYEHSDPREGEHEDWGTLIFNFGRHEVRNFLSANALFWLEKFHLDGLRVDAVASMLYRDYSRKHGEWIPNVYGGRENLEAMEFLQSMNHLVHDKFPGVVTIAEESTAWPMVSRPTRLGGLGFTYKWNMGWMHDILDYFTVDPVFRKYHHNQITFGLWYAFNENFVLVLSHDEVVHGKRSLLEKMPGDIWQKYANLRALYAFMYGHPGKKLIFQGGEIGTHKEWDPLQSIDWHILTNEDDGYHHHGLLQLICDLNRLYRTEAAMWEQDFSPAGFSWIDHTDQDNSVVSFIRRANDQQDELVFVCNFTPVVRDGYRVGVPAPGFYQEILNSDAVEYGGSGSGNMGGVQSDPQPWHELGQSVSLRLPPLGVLVLKRR